MKSFNKILILMLLFFAMVSVSFAYLYFAKENKNGELNFRVTSNGDTISTAEKRIENSNIISNQRSSLITETVKSASPAVVGITVTEILEYRDPYVDDPFYRFFFGDRSRQYKSQSRGSGVIISNDGFILTNDHVAGSGSEITVTLTNGKHYKAERIGTDPISDICLLKISEKNLSYIKFGNSDDAIIGEWVIALGNPFGLFEINNKPIVTVGVVSATGMNLEPVNNRYYLGMIQTDAAINGGNSGGPLINSAGELIGINTLIYGAQGNIGIGFAIPINKVSKIVNELKRNGEVDRNFWIGMRVQNIDEEIAKYYKLPNISGVIVTYIDKNSPSDKAGIQVGDIITTVEGIPVNNDRSLIGIFQEFRTGESIKINIIRENKSQIKTMKLEKR